MAFDNEILAIDMVAYEQGTEASKSKIVKDVMESLKTGFIYVKTDLSSTLLDSAYTLWENFFSSSADVKNSYYSESSHGGRGYTGLLIETATDNDKPDWKEMFNWGNDIPDGHPLLNKYPLRYKPQVYIKDEDAGVENSRSIMIEFHDSLVQLQTRFLKIIAVGLGANENYFDKMVKYGTHLTRAIHYPPMAIAPDVGAGKEPYYWSAEHADINLITALPRATAKGLQVRVDEEEGKWVDASPPEGHVIINTGILLEHLSNGVIPSGWHRVAADEEQYGGRISVVQFCHPSPDTILTPIHSTVSKENPLRYSSVSSEDLLQEYLWKINLL